LVYTVEEVEVETAKLFMNGRSQAVRLPKGFRFEGDEVFIKRMGDAVLLFPRRDPWRTLIGSLEDFSEDFMEEREQPREDQIRSEEPFG
jgi:antitoxin VapB